MYKLPTSDNLNITKGGMGVLNYINEVTSGLFPNLFLIAIFIILGFGINGFREDYPASFVSAGFITLIIAIIFRIAELINNWSFGMAIGLEIILFLLFWTSRD